jgi:hypothetical protein
MRSKNKVFIGFEAEPGERIRFRALARRAKMSLSAYVLMVMREHAEKARQNEEQKEGAA